MCWYYTSPGTPSWVPHLAAGAGRPRMSSGQKEIDNPWPVSYIIGIAQGRTGRTLPGAPTLLEDR